MTIRARQRITPQSKLRKDINPVHNLVCAVVDAFHAWKLHLASKSNRISTWVNLLSFQFRFLYSLAFSSMSSIAHSLKCHKYIPIQKNKKYFEKNYDNKIKCKLVQVLNQMNRASKRVLNRLWSIGPDLTLTFLQDIEFLYSFSICAKISFPYFCLHTYLDPFLH